MAINTAAGAGVQITSSAKNGTLGSQVGAASNEIIMPSAITTNNGNLVGSPSFVGRLIMIRKGTATEEIRYCTAVNTLTLTVHEDWIVPPTSGDAYDVSYILADAATVTGLTLINKRVADYSSSRRFQVLSGGWFAFLDGVSLETNDNGSTTVADFIVNSGGILDNGYLAGGTPVSGGYMIGTPATAGELVFDVQSGAITRLYDWFLTCVQQNRSYFNGEVYMNKVKIFSGSHTMDLSGGATDLVSLENVTIEGKGATTDTIEISQYTTIDGAVVIATNGFITTDNATTETLEIRNVQFLPNNLRFINVNNDKTWNVVNPTWTVDTTSQSDIAFENGTNNEVRELFSLDVDVRTPAGAGIEGAELYVYEGTINQNLPTDNQLSTTVQVSTATINAGGTSYAVDDVLTISGGTSTTAATLTVTSVSGGVITGVEITEPGNYSVLPTNPVSVTGGTGTSATFDLTWDSITASSDVLKRTFNDNAGTSLTTVTYGDFALKVYKYGRVPFVGALDVTAPITSVVGMTLDTAITESSSATAITNGSGIVVDRHATGETDPRPMKVLNYDAGTGSVPTVGETVTQGSATGVVVEYIGDAVSGTLVLETWNGTEFTDNQTITGGTSSFSATTDLAGGTGFYQEYTWLVDGNSLALTVIYDYLAAKMAAATPDAIFQDAIIWGEDEQTQLLYSGANGFFTEYNANLTEGVWIANYGAGTVASMKSDAGVNYVPPVQYSFTLTGLQSNSEVRIYNAGTNELIDGIENSGTSFTHTYIYSSDVSIYVVIFHLSYKEIRLTGLTLSNSNQSIPIQQIIDRVYSNP